MFTQVYDLIPYLSLSICRLWNQNLSALTNNVHHWYEKDDGTLQMVEIQTRKLSHQLEYLETYPNKPSKLHSTLHAKVMLIVRS